MDGSERDVTAQAPAAVTLPVSVWPATVTVTGAPKLPLNLLDALREYEKDEDLQVAMGSDFSAAYLKLKHNEWNAYASHFTAWERESTLDI